MRGLAAHTLELVIDLTIVAATVRVYLFLPIARYHTDRCMYDTYKHTKND